VEIDIGYLVVRLDMGRKQGGWVSRMDRRMDRRGWMGKGRLTISYMR